MSVFSLVPQTEQLKNEVMHSVIIMIQEDLKPVSKKAECLGWVAHCFLETLKSCKWRGGGSWMRGEVRHSYQALHGLRHGPWVTFEIFKAWEGFEKWTGVSHLFSEPCQWGHRALKDTKSSVCLEREDSNIISTMGSEKPYFNKLCHRKCGPWNGLSCHMVVCDLHRCEGPSWTSSRCWANMTTWPCPRRTSSSTLSSSSASLTAQWAGARQGGGRVWEQEKGRFGSQRERRGGMVGTRGKGFGILNSERWARGDLEPKDSAITSFRFKSFLFLFQNEEDIQLMCSKILQLVQTTRVKEASSSSPLTLQITTLTSRLHSLCLPSTPSQLHLTSCTVSSTLPDSVWPYSSAWGSSKKWLSGTEEGHWMVNLEAWAWVLLGQFLAVKSWVNCSPGCSFSFHEKAGDYPP